MLDEEWRPFHDHVVSNFGTILGPKGECTAHNQAGYRNFTSEGRAYNHHRVLATLFVVNPRPDIFDEVDHIDGDPSEDHWTNIRWVNAKLNALNKHKKRVKKPVLGKDGKLRWHVQVSVRGKRRYYGAVYTEEAYRKKVKATQQAEFARLYKELTGDDSCGIGSKFYKTLTPQN